MANVGYLSRKIKEANVGCRSREEKKVNVGCVISCVD